VVTGQCLLLVTSQSLLATKQVGMQGHTIQTYTSYVGGEVGEGEVDWMVEFVWCWVAEKKVRLRAGWQLRWLLVAAWRNCIEGPHNLHVYKLEKLSRDTFVLAWANNETTSPARQPTSPPQCTQPSSSLACLPSYSTLGALFHSVRSHSQGSMSS
jgi:hypothetical protein